LDIGCEILVVFGNFNAKKRAKQMKVAACVGCDTKSSNRERIDSRRTWGKSWESNSYISKIENNLKWIPQLPWHFKKPARREVVKNLFVQV
jgi:hypothetical protein